jgi:hypothetical protein
MIFALMTVASDMRESQKKLHEKFHKHMEVKPIILFEILKEKSKTKELSSEILITSLINYWWNTQAANVFSKVLRKTEENLNTNLPKDKLIVLRFNAHHFRNVSL